MKFKVRCSVSGGLTGYRIAFLKAISGEDQVFETFEAAAAEAARLKELMSPKNLAEGSMVRFEYCPAEVV